jgi:hypothetical protein
MSRPAEASMSESCSVLRTDSVYQPLLPSLRAGSDSAPALLKCSGFIRSFNQFNSMSNLKEMHI